MKKLYALLFGILTLSAAASAATFVDQSHFLVDTADDLVILCSAGPDDPHQEQALSFCLGYVTGAYHYHLKSTGGPAGKGFVCVPDPAPSRNEAVASYVAWMGEHPDLKQQDAVDTLFQWAANQYPCP